MPQRVIRRAWRWVATCAVFLAKEPLEPPVPPQVTTLHNGDTRDDHVYWQGPQKTNQMTPQHSRIALSAITKRIIRKYNEYSTGT